MCNRRTDLPTYLPESVCLFDFWNFQVAHEYFRSIIQDFPSGQIVTRKQKHSNDARPIYLTLQGEEPAAVVNRQTVLTVNRQTANKLLTVNN